jgi:hypothetical protein
MIGRAVVIESERVKSMIIMVIMNYSGVIN